MKVFLNQFFERFGTPITLVSHNGPEFVSGDLKQWCESLGIKKMESPIYQPRANGPAERRVQTVKRAIQAWNLGLFKPGLFKSEFVIWGFSYFGL